MNLKQKITHNLLNILGWRTKRHLVVIESDDWGAIRMPSKEVYDKLLSKGYRVDLNKYEKYDSLATEKDLTELFNILCKYTDINGNHPLITTNCAVANPDFEKIKESDFQNYYYEPFTETLKRYQGCENSFELWQEGMKEGLFKPQFHAREHLNVSNWIHSLQNDEDTKHVFDYGIMGLFPKGKENVGNKFQVALGDTEFPIQTQNEIIKEGLDLFEKIFNYKSKTFIAPCYTWNPGIEKTLYDNGVIGIQGLVYQKVPCGNSIRHWMGSKNAYGQIYTIRNAFFEPTLSPNIDNVEDCLYRIECAFRWNKPAIISSHRINYIGAINEHNRDNNLKQLDGLLTKIQKKWGDVEFISSDKLVDIISNT